MRTSSTWSAATRVLVAACSIFVCHHATAAQFEEATTNAGITRISGYCMGVAWGDYDNDGRIDLYLASGGPSVHVNDLYRNLGDGTFAHVGAEAGPITTDSHSSFGCAWIDFNNDGFRDLFVVNGGFISGRNDVYWNHGDGTFGSISAPELTSRTGFFSWPAFADYDADGWVDVFQVEGNRMRVFHATGPATFAPVNFGPTINYGNSGVWGDFDTDGDPDLFTCNYTGGPSALWRNDGRDQFTRMTNGLPANAATLHAAWADYDNDGDLDIALGSFPSVAIYRNDGDAGFVRATNYIGNLTTPAWADYDNDGHPDLVVVGGQDSPAKAGLFHNNGDGTFTRAQELFTEVVDYRLGCAWGDYDDDGFPDLAIVQQQGRNRLFHNLGNANHWIKFKLLGTASNRDAIGAKVHVTATIAGETVTQLQEVNGGYAVQNDMRPNFGLGDATNVDVVRIEWPSGNVQELMDVAPNQILTVTEYVGITPTNPSASLNGSVKLMSTLVFGTTYQWQFEGADLIDQTNRTLNLTNLVADQQGRYSVIVSNAATLVTNFVYLHVDTTFTKITDGPEVTDRGNAGYLGWGDWDGDGYPDLAVSRWRLGTSEIYRNNSGDGTFTPIPTPPFMKPSDSINPSGDLDNDGRLDLAVWNPTDGVKFCFDDGQGNWSSFSFGSGANSSWSVSLVDYDRDGFLDIYFTNFGNSKNRLYRNNGNRTFTQKFTADVGPLVNVGSYGGASWADFDDDGWVDVYAGSIQGNRSLMFRNDGTGHFVAVNNLVTTTAGPALSGAWGDYDNDGRLDLFVARYNGTSTLYRNLGMGQFERPATAPTLSGPHNSASWADYDNDGFLDLFVSGSETGNKLFHNNGDGTFTRVRIGSIVNDRPLAGAYTYEGMWFDYDRDGFLDLYVGNGDDAASLWTANFLYHNHPNGNHWLHVRLIGTSSNPQGIGAKVRAQARYAGQTRWQRRDITAGDFYNGNQLEAQFGLGNATVVQTLRIEWPSGTIEELTNIAVNQILTIVEPSLGGACGTDGLFHVTMTGNTNQTYQLDASPDLLNWTTLTNCAGAGPGGKIEVCDPAAGEAQRFYRMH